MLITVLHKGIPTLQPDTDSTETVPLVEWHKFVAQFRWKQGEHVGLIGPTGSGKTNMAFWLLPMREYVTIFGTKPKDGSLKAFGKDNGYKVLQQWEKLSVKRHPHRIIWPNARTLNAEVTQRKVFTEAMQTIYIQGGWCVYIDELWYFGHVLNMTHNVKVYLQQARSMGISLVVASQRPAWIPVEVYDQSTHLFFWRDSDYTNLKRISGIGWLNAEVIQNAVARLPQYHVLYVNTRTGQMMITRPPAPKKG